MSEEMSIAILGKNIQISEGRVNITDLLYNKDNPRVYSILYGENSKVEQNEDMQEGIYKVMLQQRSVKNIKQDIYDYGGLLDPILIRHDTMEVIEGNSRLTVYKFLNAKYPHDEKWQTMSCRIVSKLTDEQQDAYLNYIHIKGKTDWSPYEKANFIYRRNKKGVSISDLANRFSETENEIRKRIQSIDIMISNNDYKQTNFSYYNDVMVRTSNVYQKILNDPKFKNLLLKKIKDESIGKALPLRDKLRKIVDNPRQLKKFCNETTTLDEAYESVKTSDPDAKLSVAIKKIQDITKSELNNLEQSDLTKIEYRIKKISKEIERIKKMIEQCKQ